MVEFDINILADITLMGKTQKKNVIKMNNIRDADLTENYMYILMKFRTGVHVFCWEVSVFNRSCFQTV